jgi:uncharacterized membrane protein YhaH (DUF805 family)
MNYNPASTSANKGKNMTKSNAQFYFSTSGRCSRGDYWRRYFFPTVIALVVMPLIIAPLPHFLRGVILVPFSILVVWVSVAVQVKRWHDINRSGWYALLFLIPIVGPFISIYVNGTIAGTDGDNSYGADPFQKMPND